MIGNELTSMGCAQQREPDALKSSVNVQVDRNKTEKLSQERTEARDKSKPVVKQNPKKGLMTGGAGNQTGTKKWKCQPPRKETPKKVQSSGMYMKRYIR